MAEVNEPRYSCVRPPVVVLDLLGLVRAKVGLVITRVAL